MFEQLVDSSSNKKNRTSPWAFALSLSIQMLMLFSMILITMIQMEALPESMQLTFLAAPPPPPPPPPPPAAKVVRRVVRRVSQVQAGRVIAPKVIPKEIADIVEDEAPPEAPMGGVVGGVVGGVLGGQMGGVIGGVIGGIPSAAPPPPPVEILRISSGVQEARRIRMVKPVFPPIARQARISGTVKLEALIGKDGTVQNLKVISGHPLLSQAAIQAVQQWRYAPTLLNGKPVPVITLIDVIFKMN